MISLQSNDNAPTFDDPLGMLHACHGKILRQCETLKKLVPHLATRGCDEQARQAAINIMRYFDTSGQFHHQDEEEDLFPALKTAVKDAEDATRLDALQRHLLNEHIALLASWNKLREGLLKLTNGQDTSLDNELTRHFIIGYTEHIEIEENQLLPLAARLLTIEQLERIGRNMSARRGLRPPVH